MKFQLAKRGIYFIPATDGDKEKAVKVGQGEVVQVEFKKNRNTLFHRKFFALLNIGFSNQDVIETFELYRAYVLVSIGWSEFFFTETGQINHIPKSISYEALPDNNEFSEVYDKALSFIAIQLSLTNSELTDEVLSNF